MKKYVFIHESLLSDERYFQEDTFFEDLTDEQILEVIRNSEDYFLYNTFEDYLLDFNADCGPDSSCWYGRAIEFND